MRENRTLRSVRFLQAVSEAKQSGTNCPNALLEAYREEWGEQYPAALALAEHLAEMLNEPHL